MTENKRVIKPAAGGKRTGQKRPPKLPTPSRLANIALHYLARYAASEAGLRRVLQNRIRRAAMRDPEFAADAARQSQLQSAIEMIIESHKKTGAINDASFAETKAHALRRAGKSRRAIEQKLGGKGVSRELIKGAVDEVDAAGDDADAAQNADLKAAIRLARRRRMGPWRNPLTTSKASPEDRHKKEVSTMARAGFSFAIIRRVLDTDIDAMDED